MVLKGFRGFSGSFLILIQVLFSVHFFNYKALHYIQLSFNFHSLEVNELPLLNVTSKVFSAPFILIRCYSEWIFSAVCSIGVCVCIHLETQMFTFESRRKSLKKKKRVNFSPSTYLPVLTRWFGRRTKTMLVFTDLWLRQQTLGQVAQNMRNANVFFSDPDQEPEGNEWQANSPTSTEEIHPHYFLLFPGRWPLQLECWLPNCCWDLTR